MNSQPHLTSAQKSPESLQEYVLPDLNEQKEENYLVAKIRAGGKLGGLKIA